MDLRSYFKSSAKPSSKEQLSHHSSSEEKSNVPQAKRTCSASTGVAGPSTKYEGSCGGKRKYQQRREKEFTWLEFDADSEGAYCKLCKKFGRALECTGGVWITRLFTNWKKNHRKNEGSCSN